MSNPNDGAQKGGADVACSAWLGGLRYFVLSGPIPPITVYRLQPDSELEIMLSLGWSKSVTNQMTGLHEMSEGAARFIWERLFQPPNESSSPIRAGGGGRAEKVTMEIQTELGAEKRGADSVQRLVMPRRLRLLKDWPFVVTYGDWAEDRSPTTIVLRAGTIGEYFDHSATFIWPSEQGYAPWILSDVLKKLPEWWESA